MKIFTLRSVLSHLLPAGALLLSLGACSSSRYVLVKPATGSGQWQDGMETVAAKQDSLSVRLGVVSTTGPWLEFDVTVQNRSRRPVLVAPEAFYLDAYSTTAGVGALRVQAENPEQNLQTLQQQAAYHRQKASARPATEMLSTLSNLLDDLSSRPRHENAARLRLVMPVAGRQLAGEFTQQCFRLDGQPATARVTPAKAARGTR